MAEKKSEADRIWDLIKDQDIDLYALPGQTVSMHCTRCDVMPNEVHLLLKSSAVLPALEEVLKKIKIPKTETFEIAQASRYTVVKLVPKLI